MDDDRRNSGTGIPYFDQWPHVVQALPRDWRGKRIPYFDQSPHIVQQHSYQIGRSMASDCCSFLSRSELLIEKDAISSVRDDNHLEVGDA
jgi:hypothetical protein